VCVVTKGGGAPSASRTLIVQSFYRPNCSGPFNPFTVTFFKQWHALQTISCLYIRFVHFSFYSVNFAAQFTTFSTSKWRTFGNEFSNCLDEGKLKQNAGAFKVVWADTLVHASAFWSELVGTIWLQTYFIYQL